MTFIRLTAEECEAEIATRLERLGMSRAELQRRYDLYALDQDQYADLRVIEAFEFLLGQRKDKSS